MKGEPDLTSPHTLSPAALKELQLVYEKINEAQLQHTDYDNLIYPDMLPSINSPRAALVQEMPQFGTVKWIHLSSQEVKTATLSVDLRAKTIIQGRLILNN